MRRTEGGGNMKKRTMVSLLAGCVAAIGAAVAVDMNGPLGPGGGGVNFDALTNPPIVTNNPIGSCCGGVKMRIENNSIPNLQPPDALCTGCCVRMRLTWLPSNGNCDKLTVLVTQDPLNQPVYAFSLDQDCGNANQSEFSFETKCSTNGWTNFWVRGISVTDTTKPSKIIAYLLNCCTPGPVDGCSVCSTNVFPLPVVELLSATGFPQVVSVASNVTFTALMNPQGYEDSVVKWNGGGTPSEGTGKNFTTSWSTPGVHVVQAHCGVTPDCGNVVSATATVIKVELAVDGNRDDNIDFNNPVDQRYTFWVNDDIDVISGGEEDDAVSGTTNCIDDVITCKRDLEDFARLHIKVDDNIVNLPGITYWLKFEGVTDGSPMINVFEAVKTTTEYLSTANVASDQILKQNLTPNGVGTAEVPIDPQCIKAGNEVSPFIFEGRQEGTGSLTFIVKLNGNEICRKSVILELHEMPWFYDLYSVEVSFGNNWDVYVGSDASKRMPIAGYHPATDENFLLVHGWNMTDPEKTQWPETVFKRLWWQGYQGSVSAFSWPTLSGINNLGNVIADPGNFDDSEFRSWLSSDALIGVFNTLNAGGKLRVMAHSMGNVVTSEAIHRYAGVNLHTYIACQAAFSAQFYDNTVAAMSPCKYQSMASFPDTPDVMGHFWTGDATTNSYMMNGNLHVNNMQNYYNPQDWALDKWEINNVFRPDGVLYLFGYFGSVNHYDDFNDKFFRGPLSNPYETLYITVPRDSYTIFSYCAESRSRALGQAANGKFQNWKLNEPIANGGMGYDTQHYSHSREFRSDIPDEWKFWKRVFGTCQFIHP